jgi:DNA-binding MarR family transcriptional regulator
MLMRDRSLGDESTAVSEDELARLSAAWEEFIVAVRRARARRGEPEEGLSLSQYEFVRPLTACDGLPVSRLAEKFGVAPATATQIVDALERSGIVERRRTAQDRRMVTISLTPEGHQQAERKRRSLAGQHRRFLKTLAPEERGQTERLLRHLAQVIAEL